MIKLLKEAVITALIRLLSHYRTVSVDLLKIQGVTYYVKGVRGVRQLSVALLCVAALIGVGVSGFLLFHAGLAVLIYGLSGSWVLAGAVLLVLGLIYVGVVVLALCYYTDEGNWMRWTGASRLVEKVTGEQEKD